MNRRTMLLPLTVAAVLFRPWSQAQTPVGTSSTSSAAVDTLKGTSASSDSSVSNGQDAGEAANAIRIVRLSQASGKVELDRNTSLGFEAAFNNLPVTQGARLKTNEGSAEVEFEDGSTLRLIPDTQVNFTQLGRSASGFTLSTINVLRGTVYVSLNKTKGNLFSLTSGDGMIKPRPGAHLRLEARDPESRLSVIGGTAEFINTAGSREVGKAKSLIFNTATHAPADLVAGVEDEPFDSWDEEQTEYQKRYSRGNALAGSGSAYGLADLNYYGYFSNVDGCGNLWRPYFASAAWDPYASGLWAWYPIGGYSWVSPYPWGWAPFHYGSWLQCGGGWGWQPGGRWYGLGTIRGPQRILGPHPVHPFPTRPRPTPGKPLSIIAVNEKPLTFSHVDRATQSFAFRNDSAGLGIPRGEFDKLSKFSATAVKTGSSNAPLFFIPPGRTDLSPVGSRDLTVRNDRTSGARVGDHPGVFNRGGANGSGPSATAQYPSSSHTAAGGYAGGVTYSGGSHASGGGYSAGGAHASAPASAPSAPSASTTAASGGHR